MSRIRANNIVNGAGTGAPTFPNGAVINGITTITADVTLNTAQLNGTDANFSGILTTAQLKGTDANFSGIGTYGVVSLGTGTSISSPSSNVLTLGTNDTEALRITANGGVGVNTTTVAAGVNVAVGGTIRVQDTTDATQYLTISHLGIDFQNTGAGSSTSATAHTLDDYEEGTFTPTVGAGSVTALSNVTYSRRQGTYVKIGRTVYFALDIASSIAWGSIGASSEGFTIQGLPFTCEQIGPSQIGGKFYINVYPARYWSTPWPTSQSPSNDSTNWNLSGNSTVLFSVTSRNGNSDYTYTVSDWDSAASNSTRTFETQIGGTYTTVD